MNMDEVVEIVSAELKDLRAKITMESYAMLEANARVKGIEISEQVRSILHEWAMRQIEVASVADSLLRTSGSAGICGERCRK